MSDSMSMIKPYEGDKNYIFISYSHSDSDKVLPLLAKLSDNGYRIWFDEGIDPGTEWPEAIATHLSGCKVLLAFLSNNSINSSNCKREINYGISLNKDFLSVALEPIKMTPGLEMQISSYQSLLSYKYPNQETFEEKLMSLDILKSCQEVVVHEVKDEIPDIIVKKENELPKEEEAVSVDVDKENVKTSKKEEKARIKEQKKASKIKKNSTPGKKGVGKIILIGVLVLAGLLFWITQKSGSSSDNPLTPGKQLVIGDVTYDDSRYITIENQTLTEENMKILSQFEKCYNITFKNCVFSDNSTSLLKDLASLNYLTFENCENLGNLSFVNSYRKLYSFTAKNCGLTDSSLEGVVFPERCGTIELDYNNLTKIPAATDVRKLSMGNNKLVNLSGMESYANLEYGSFNNNQIEDISGLANCVKVKELNLNFNKIKDISALEPFVYLQKLYIGYNSISDATPLRYTTLLQIVNISGNKDINDYSFLEGNAGTLKWLNICGIDINKLPFINKLVNLETIWAYDCKISDLSFVSKMTKLKELYVARNNITDLSPLKYCNVLSVLNVAKNKITSLEGLPASNEYWALVLNDNHITTLTGFAKNTKIRFIAAYNNPISDVSGLSDKGIYRIIIDMNEGINPENLKKCYRIYVPEKNLAIQVKWDQALGTKLYYESLDSAWEESLDYCYYLNSALYVK